MLAQSCAGRDGSPLAWTMQSTAGTSRHCSYYTNFRFDAQRALVMMETHHHRLVYDHSSQFCHATHDSLSTEPLSLKRPRPHVVTDAGPPHAVKRIKTALEEPSLYSENVRKKLAATTRTGQACDRCKERKMKCDPDPIACQPCRAKNLSCYTTDRVTGQARERGQNDRTETEVSLLRSQLAQYERRYGPLPSEPPQTPHSTLASSPTDERKPVLKHGPEVDGFGQLRSDIPSATYLGWPASSEHGIIHKCPVQGTQADILEWGIIDSGDFVCDLMQESSNPNAAHFNFSTSSILRTINQQQKISDPQLRLPSKSETLAFTETFLTVLWGYVPIVHKPSFMRLVHQLYDAPDSVSLPEKIQVVQMLAILHHQTYIRNHAQSGKIEDAYRFLHYCLGYYPFLMQDSSLSSMQALAMILILMRNLPKPGHTWTLAQEMLVRSIDLDYHRDPDKITLPPEQDNPLAKELRKRVFHCIFAICVTTGCRLGRPSPWQFVKWDVPLPMAIKDEDISVHGLQQERSGRCDFWPALHLAKLLPLFTELYNHVLSVRRSAQDYVKIVAALHTKIDAWRADWDKRMVNEDKNSLSIIISTLLIDSWHAEYLLNLYHPTVCTARTSERLEENLDICYKAAKRLLTNFFHLSKKHKATDFTWHSTIAYTLGFGLTLHYYKRRTNSMSQEQFNAIKNELAGWVQLVGYADLVLRTGNYLVPKFKVLVDEVQAHLEPCVVRPPQNSRLPNGSVQHRANSSNSVKQEYSPQTPLEQQSVQVNPAYSNEYVPPSDQQHSHSSASYHTAQNSLPPTSYPRYSPPAVPYPSLPTSLTPLLDEMPPATVSHHQSSPAFPQDPTVMFAPHLYTDATAVWPVIPEGATY